MKIAASLSLALSAAWFVQPSLCIEDAQEEFTTRRIRGADSKDHLRELQSGGDRRTKGASDPRCANDSLCKNGRMVKLGLRLTPQICDSSSNTQQADTCSQPRPTKFNNWLASNDGAYVTIDDDEGTNQFADYVERDGDIEIDGTRTNANNRFRITTYIKIYAGSDDTAPLVQDIAFKTNCGPLNNIDVGDSFGSITATGSTGIDIITGTPTICN